MECGIWQMVRTQKKYGISSCGMVNEVHVDNFNIYWFEKSL